MGSQRVRHDRETQHARSQAGRHGRLSEAAEDPGELQPGSLLPRGQACWGAGALDQKEGHGQACQQGFGLGRSEPSGLKFTKF